ncbi:MAG TPA: hypothetical protein VN081_02250 [Dongiaceae bacterium]|nr:hypothetical protein [Dongiaceae bacterium]
MGKTIDFVNTEGNGRVEGGDNRRIQIDVTQPYADTKILAYLEKSSRSQNASKGQNYHWELAPEWVIILEKIRDNSEELTKIAEKLQTPVDVLNDGQILTYIAATEAAKQAVKDKKRVSKDEIDYFAEIAALREKEANKGKKPATDK